MIKEINRLIALVFTVNNTNIANTTKQYLPLYMAKY